MADRISVIIQETATRDDFQHRGWRRRFLAVAQGRVLVFHSKDEQHADIAIDLHRGCVVARRTAEELRRPASGIELREASGHTLLISAPDEATMSKIESEIQKSIPAASNAARPAAPPGFPLLEEYHESSLHSPATSLGDQARLDLALSYVLVSKEAEGDGATNEPGITAEALETFQTSMLSVLRRDQEPDTASMDENFDWNTTFQALAWFLAPHRPVAVQVARQEHLAGRSGGFVGSDTIRPAEESSTVSKKKDSLHANPHDETVMALCSEMERVLEQFHQCCARWVPHAVTFAIRRQRDGANAVRPPAAEDLRIVCAAEAREQVLWDFGHVFALGNLYFSVALAPQASGTVQQGKSNRSARKFASALFRSFAAVTDAAAEVNGRIRAPGGERGAAYLAFRPIALMEYLGIYVLCHAKIPVSSMSLVFGTFDGKIIDKSPSFRKTAVEIAQRIGVVPHDVLTQPKDPQAVDAHKCTARVALTPNMNVFRGEDGLMYIGSTRPILPVEPPLAHSALLPHEQTNPQVPLQRFFRGLSVVDGLSVDVFTMAGAPGCRGRAEHVQKALDTARRETELVREQLEKLADQQAQFDVVTSDFHLSHRLHRRGLSVRHATALFQTRNAKLKTGIATLFLARSLKWIARDRVLTRLLSESAPDILQSVRNETETLCKEIADDKSALWTDQLVNAVRTLYPSLPLALETVPAFRSLWEVERWANVARDAVLAQDGATRMQPLPLSTFLMSLGAVCGKSGIPGGLRHLERCLAVRGDDVRVLNAAGVFYGELANHVEEGTVEGDLDANEREIEYLRPPLSSRLLSDRAAALLVRASECAAPTSKHVALCNYADLLGERAFAAAEAGSVPLAAPWRPEVFSRGARHALQAASDKYEAAYTAIGARIGAVSPAEAIPLRVEAAALAVHWGSLQLIQARGEEPSERERMQRMATSRLERACETLRGLLGLAQDQAQASAAPLEGALANTASSALVAGLETAGECFRQRAAAVVSQSVRVETKAKKSAVPKSAFDKRASVQADHGGDEVAELSMEELELFYEYTGRAVELHEECVSVYASMARPSLTAKLGASLGFAGALVHRCRHLGMLPVRRSDADRAFNIVLAAARGGALTVAPHRVSMLLFHAASLACGAELEMVFAAEDDVEERRPPERVCGWLHKVGQSRRSWRRRWFRLLVGSSAPPGAPPSIAYFKNEQDTVPKGQVLLRDVRDVLESPDVADAPTSHALALRLSIEGGRLFIMSAESAADHQMWLREIRRALREYLPLDSLPPRLRIQVESTAVPAEMQFASYHAQRALVRICQLCLVLADAQPVAEIARSSGTSKPDVVHDASTRNMSIDEDIVRITLGDMDGVYDDPVQPRESFALALRVLMAMDATAVHLSSLPEKLVASEMDDIVRGISCIAIFAFEDPTFRQEHSLRRKLVALGLMDVAPGWLSRKGIAVETRGALFDLFAFMAHEADHRGRIATAGVLKAALRALPQQTQEEAEEEEEDAQDSETAGRQRLKVADELSRAASARESGRTTAHLASISVIRAATSATDAAEFDPLPMRFLPSAVSLLLSMSQVPYLKSSIADGGAAALAGLVDAPLSVLRERAAATLLSLLASTQDIRTKVIRDVGRTVRRVCAEVLARVAQDPSTVSILVEAALRTEVQASKRMSGIVDEKQIVKAAAFVLAARGLRPSVNRKPPRTPPRVRPTSVLAKDSPVLDDLQPAAVMTLARASALAAVASLGSDDGERLRELDLATRGGTTSSNAAIKILVALKLVKPLVRVALEGSCEDFGVDARTCTSVDGSLRARHEVRLLVSSPRCPHEVMDAVRDAGGERLTVVKPTDPGASLLLAACEGDAAYARALLAAAPGARRSASDFAVLSSGRLSAAGVTGLPMIEDKFRGTPLTAAAALRRASLIRLLIGEGLPLDARSVDDVNLLCHLCDAGLEGEALQVLGKHSAPLDDVVATAIRNDLNQMAMAATLYGGEVGSAGHATALSIALQQSPLDYEMLAAILSKHQGLRSLLVDLEDEDSLPLRDALAKLASRRSSRTFDVSVLRAVRKIILKRQISGKE